MDFALARHNMVESQIRTNRVTDEAVIDAMEDLPRQDFLPEAFKLQAYIDEDITVAPGRIMMEPMVLARLLQTARVEDTDLCLVVGSATGYEAAVLSRLGSAVVALESNADLAKASKDALAELDVNTVSVLEGDLTKGHPGQGPYDVILINGAVGALPDVLTEQLSEGGRLVYVKDSPTVGGGKGVVVSLENGVHSELEVFDANIPPLPEFAAKPEFTF